MGRRFRWGGVIKEIRIFLRLFLIPGAFGVPVIKDDNICVVWRYEYFYTLRDFFEESWGVMKARMAFHIADKYDMAD